MHNKLFMTGIGIGIVIGVLLSASAVVLAGNLNPSGGPTTAGSQMYTLEQIYNRVNTGATSSKMSAFTEPSSAPGTGTMHTLDEIYTLVGQRSLVPKTGQTTFYATGDDGDLEKGKAWPSPRLTSNVDNNGDGDCVDAGETCDGTVTDNMTGLIWLKNNDCPEVWRTWSQALTDVAQLNTNGTMNGHDCGDTSNGGNQQTDWRLPNIREFLSLINYGFYNPALPLPNDFPYPEGYYWSSTTSNQDSSNAWVMYIFDGDVLDRSKTETNNYVWPVRGGQ
jgi:hypothetical protein